ncbi:hypothetical protein CUMW_170870, partial [Citrus unshiu]
SNTISYYLTQFFPLNLTCLQLPEGERKTKKTRPFESLRARKRTGERVWIREGNHSNVPLTQPETERTGGNCSESSLLGVGSPLPSIPLHFIVSLAQLNNTGFASSPLRSSLLSIQLKFSLSISPLFNP